MSASRGSRIFNIGLFFVILFALFNQRILYAMGAMLVNAGPPRKADMIVVLGGDWEGNRILKATELMREGYAPQALISGVGHMYAHFESDLAVDYAVSRGAQRESFIPTHDANNSTVQETRNDMRELRARHVHRIIVVTSEFHTGRALRIFRREGPDMEVAMVAADTPEWYHGMWWKNREGQKVWLTEFEKNVADFLRI